MGDSTRPTHTDRHGYDPSKYNTNEKKRQRCVFFTLALVSPLARDPAVVPFVDGESVPWILKKGGRRVKESDAHSHSSGGKNQRVYQTRREINQKEVTTLTLQFSPIWAVTNSSRRHYPPPFDDKIGNPVRRKR